MYDESVSESKSSGLALVLGGAVLLGIGALLGLTLSTSSNVEPDAAPIEVAAQPPSAEGDSVEVPAKKERRRVRLTHTEVVDGAREVAEAAARERFAELERARKRLRQKSVNSSKRPGVPHPPPLPVVSESKLLNSLFETKHPDGSDFRRGWILDGKRDGLWTTRYEDGARSETTYTMGVRDGTEAAWHADGKRRYVGEYADGEMNGTWTAWHDNGTLLSTREYTGGKLHGWLRTFHPNGVLEEESWYEEGLEHGTNRGWHENGELAWEHVYIDGKRQGEALWFDRLGTLTAKGNYVDDKLHGEYVAFLPDGDVRTREHWDHGVDVTETK